MLLPIPNDVPVRDVLEMHHQFKEKERRKREDVILSIIWRVETITLEVPDQSYYVTVECEFIKYILRKYCFRLNLHFLNLFTFSIFKFQQWERSSIRRTSCTYLINICVTTIRSLFCNVIETYVALSL